MIISRTPFRISFFGGGTDYPAWYRQHGGKVLATTIDKYCYLTCRRLPPFFEHRIRLVYSAIENCKTVDEIKHPAAREVLRFLKMDIPLEVHHDADLPARSGMGSSSAFTVGLLNSLYALTGRITGKHQLAMESIEVEQERLRENVGSQDQVSAAYGGLNHITFSPSGEVHVSPMTLDRTRIEELEKHLMLFYTGIQRTASDVANSYVHDMEKRAQQLQTTAGLVDEALAILSSGDDITRFGSLLHEAWQAKRGLSAAVSNPEVEALYAEALAGGALGGKLTGAGGGGFMLLFAPPSKHVAIRERLSRLIHVPFEFEFTGSQIIFFTPDRDYSSAERDRLSHPISPFHELGTKP